MTQEQLLAEALRHDKVLAAEIHRLHAENEALRKDAERYRWLRDEAQWIDNVPQAVVWTTGGHSQSVCAEDELDAAIDAAMKGQS